MLSESADQKQCQILGGQIKKDVCIVDGYPTATGNQVHLHYQMEKLSKCEILHLRPEDFLKLVPPTLFESKIIEKLKQRIINKEPLDVPFIEYSEHDFRGLLGRQMCHVGHEGRHRAKAAELLGIEKIPVMLCKEHLEK